MSDDNKEVKEFIERVEITPATGEDEELVDMEEKETPAESSQQEQQEEETGDETESEEEESKKPDQLVKRPQTGTKSEPPKEDEIADVENETPRERALRLELTRMRRAATKERAGELIKTQDAPKANIDIAPEKKALLDKYKPEEIAALRETVDILAEEMGFVRKEQLAASTYVETANEALNTFTDKHPEYLPENDKDGTLWGAFKAEYALYKQPDNPKDFAKIFERVHRDVFGIKPASGLSKINAQREKKSVASHTGASSAPTTPQRQSSKAPQGLRTDMLKGFSDEELAELGE